ncbi:zinc finger TRAF-type-containing protein 1 homolog isoform X2 [Chironomus tepperi]|uniref:zinc finger TRAF-type-containing protein 1 homolog isoform X2 n=1 Tax=Chironomus tepperi TaxID=113505 RepID=UPI00391FC743
MAELTANLPFSSNLITAEIRVENLSESSSTISIPQPSQSSVMSQQMAVEEPDNNNTSNMSKQQQKEFDEPESKRQKLDGKSMKGKKFEKLESRLGSVLCCAVCLDLPKTAMYQCVMGHLMCAGCFTHLLADSRLRDQVATCPNCRVEISKNNATRNLAVEKAVSELPSECQFCNQEFPRSTLDHHERNECDERPTECKYFLIGCQWNGPMHEAIEHEAQCAHPKKSGADVMGALKDREAHHEEEKKLFSCLVDLLSYEKITFNDLRLQSYRTDEFIHKLFYETTRFSAFNHQWIVKAIVNNSQRDVHQSNDRFITYQVALKTKTQHPLSIHFFVLPGPFSDMKVNAKIYKHDFTDNENESAFNLLPLPDTAECNRLLAAKTINLRLVMFLASN